jgi:hypothetical protein
MKSGISLVIKRHFCERDQNEKTIKSRCDEAALQPAAALRVHRRF